MRPAPAPAAYMRADFALEAASLCIVPALLFFLPARAPFADAWTSFLLLGPLPCAVFYAVCAAFFAADACAPRAWAAARKTQGAAGLVRAGAYARALTASARSWALVGLPFAFLVASRLAPARGCPRAAAPWAPRELAAHLFPFVLIVDAVFWATHRALHARGAFARVHARHHEFSAPFALAAVHAHPLEHLLSNVLSVSAGPLLLASHPVTAALWACLAVAATAGAHSGFRLPCARAEHDWHHEAFSQNYGTGLFLVDRLCGTYGTRAARARARHSGAVKTSAVGVKTVLTNT